MAITTAIARAASNIIPGNQDIIDASFGGGTPKACIVIWNECITTGTAIDGARFSYGFATGPSNQGCTAGNSLHNDAVSSSSRGTSEFDRVINGTVLGSSGAYCNAAFVSFITDGIRINWVQAPTIASLMTVVLLGGTDLRAHVDNYDLGPDTTVNDITAPGFKPQLIFSMGQNNNSAATQRISRGVIWDEPQVGIKQHNWSYRSVNNSNPTDISAALYQTLGLAFKNRTAASNEFELVYSDFDSQGFTTTTVAPTGDGTGTDNLYLALSFGSKNKVFFDTFQTPATLGNDARTVGFKPQLAMILFVEEVEAFTTQTRAGTRGWSVFNETSEFCESSSDEDNVDATIGGTNTQSLSSERAFEVPHDDGVLELEADFVSFDDTGYTLNYTNIPTTQRLYLQVAIEQDGELEPIENYVPDAILFDGTTDFMLRGANLTGVIDGKTGTFSVWLRLDGGDGDRLDIFGSENAGALKLVILRANTDDLQFVGRNAAGANIMNVSSVSSHTVDGLYVHMLVAWNLADSTFLLFVDDVADAGVPALSDDLIAYAGTDWVVGTTPNNKGTGLFNGALSDLWFITEFLDISSEANRRKFIDRNGDPVYLGDTGELPTGTAADVYLRGHQTDQGTNAGTGGDFVSQAVQVPGETEGPVTPEPGSASVPYVPEAILFDGTTDFMLRGADLTGISDSKFGLFSSWIRIDGKDGSQVAFLTNRTGDINIHKLSNDVFRFLMRGEDNATALDLRSTIAYKAGSTWLHLLVSWDTGNATSKLYVNDVDDSDEVTIADLIINYKAPDWFVGAFTAGVFKFEGAFADLYFSTEFLDLSVEDNRRKFIDSAGDPVFLGDDGTLPTGKFPEVYLPGTFTNQGKNTGSGGDFTSQGVQVPGETPGPVVPIAVDAGDALRLLARRAGRFHRFFRG